MRNPAQATQIIRLMAGAILLTLAMVLGTLGWSARAHDRQAAGNALRMIYRAITAQSERVQGLVLEHSIRDAAYQHAVRRDAERLWATIGPGIENGNLDTIAIYWPEDGGTMQWTAETAATLRRDVVPQALIDHMAAELRDAAVGGFDGVTAAHRLADGQVNILTAARIGRDDQDPETRLGALPVIIMGRALDRDLGRAYLVDDIRLRDTRPTDRPSLAIEGIDGAPLAWLTWRAPTPGSDMIGIALIPLAVALAVFLALAVTVTVLARRSARDLVERDLKSARIARRDPLTGLPNRLACCETLARLLRAARGPCVLLTMDVNGFKRVNDTIGHSGGDQLIALLADRVIRDLPDDAVLARIDRDAFNVIFHCDDPEDRALSYCAALNARLDAVFSVSGHSFMIDIAMGYAVACPGEVSRAELARRSDMAMYEAKNRRLAGPLKYDPALEKDAPRRKEIEHALRLSMDRSGDLLVAYQPICDAATGDMVLAEALLRWTSPELGRVSPARFIPIAESTGLIIELGFRLIDRVCRDLKTWPQLRVSVNISPAQLREAGFIGRMTAIIERHGIDPRRIEIELTEGLVAENPEMVAFKLDNLREAGHRIALDDFGTGLSSIGYLRRISFDKLKIDKAFVDDIGVNPNAETLLQSLSLLARSLDLTTVAEGVEGGDQVSRLRGMGFDLLQGYHFGPALPLDALKAAFATRIGKVPP